MHLNFVKNGIQWMLHHTYQYCINDILHVNIAYKLYQYYLYTYYCERRNQF